MFSAIQIIEKRKELWGKHQSAEIDQQYTESVTEYIIKNESLRKEIQNNPEYLIEMMFVIVDKNQQTVPFFLNKVQRLFVNDLNKAREDYKLGKRLNLKFLVLKGRQQGFTVAITAYQLASSITRKNFSGFTLADSSENTETIFEDKAKYPYNTLPVAIKPTEKYNTRRELLFEKLNSKWRVATAGNKEVGRSKTINFFHGSEAAFWDDIKKIMAGLGQALTKDSIQILESTANGYNQYKELWDEDNNWENKFYEWWLTEEYNQKFETIEAEKQFKENVTTNTDWVYQRCKWLKELHNLEWEQLYWYYNKWRDLKDLIKQEYPCTPEEAFLATGRCVFDQEIIIRHKEHLKKKYKAQEPIKGSFIFEWNDPETKDKIKDGSIKFAPNQNGYITIYEAPRAKFPYVIGGDTKGDGSDFFTGTVINNITGVRCATLHANIAPDTYTHQMYCLGKHYNTALAGIEVNFDLYPIKELQRLGYNNQYTRTIIDKKTEEKQEKYGWKTDGNTRPMIIDEQIVLLRDNIEQFNDIIFLDECLTFVYDKNGRPDAESGKHDDLLFSDMIGEAIRPQQSRRLREDNKLYKQQYNSTTGY